MQVVISPSSSVIRRNDVRETLIGTSFTRYYYRNSQLRACDYIHSMKTRLLLNQNDQLLGFLLSKIIDLSAKKDSLVRFSISLIKIRSSNGYESKLNLKENSIRPYHSINWMILFGWKLWPTDNYSKKNVSNSSDRFEFKANSRDKRFACLSIFFFRIQ